MQGKHIVIAILVFVLVGAVGYLFIKSNNLQTYKRDNTPVITSEVVKAEPDTDLNEDDLSTPPIEQPVVDNRRQVETKLGESVQGEDIIAYHFGQGETEILLVGGVHGGYSPNTIALAEEIINHFKENEESIPNNLRLTVVPNLNPDGAKKSGIAGRFNATNIDLNRNFDCEWSASGVWQERKVNGGSAPFSEPEALALRNYVQQNEPSIAIVWFSAEGKVYPSACGTSPSKQSADLATTFAKASGYPAEAKFDAYAITGDMVNWMAKEGIPAISVLLTDHKNTEWDKNLSGIEAVLAKYAE